MRTAFINQLVKEAETNDQIFLIVGDLGYNVVEVFEKKYPDRFLNAGIAEQNMIGVASGLAMQGYIVYVYSIGNFPTLRCIEQIRNDVAYHNLNVRIVSVGAGYAYGSLGASHHATEDIGVMRTLPNMTVCSPCDPVEAEKITQLSSVHQGPMYIRLGKAGEKEVHVDQYSKFNRLDFLNIGKIIPVIENNGSIAVFATGSIVYSLQQAIIDSKLSYDLYSFPFIKPIDIESLKDIVSHYNNVICIEEHQKSAGFGSAIIEQVNDFYATGAISSYPKIIRRAINDEFVYEVGNQTSLRNKERLTL